MTHDSAYPARNYDASIRQRYPRYQEMIQALIAAIPFETGRPIRVLDLGCGTGNLSCAIGNKYPNSNLTCLDCSEEMLAVARDKLRNRVSTRFLYGDFLASDFLGPCDVVVSCMAFHLVPRNDDKIRLYQKIESCLDVGGVFLNADLRLGASDYLAGLFFDDMMAGMKAGGTPAAEIQARWLPDAKSMDHPVTIEQHFQWLQEAGFSHMEVIWADHALAVWGGTKSPASDMLRE